MAAPRGWRTIRNGPDRDADIDRALDAAFMRADCDSSAVGRHWLRERLMHALNSAEDGHAEVVSIAFPEQATGGVLMPVTATVLRLATVSGSAQEAMRALAALACQDGTSQVMPTLAGLALRTHRVHDARDSFAEEVASAPIAQQERVQILADPAPVAVLRARYLLPGSQGRSWHAIAFTATLGIHEDDLVGVYLDLWDAFVGSLEWREDA